MIKYYLAYFIVLHLQIIDFQPLLIPSSPAKLGNNAPAIDAQADLVSTWNSLPLTLRSTTSSWCGKIKPTLQLKPRFQTDFDECALNFCRIFFVFVLDFFLFLCETEYCCLLLRRKQ